MFKGDYAPGEAVPETDRLSWPIDRLGEGIDELCRRSGLRSAGAEPLAVPPDLSGHNESLERWINWAGTHLGIEIEPVETPLARLDDLLAAGGPAILSYAGEDGLRFVLLMKSHGARPEILCPDLRRRRIGLAELRQRFAERHERPLYRDIDRLLDRARISTDRRPLIRGLMAGEKLATSRIGGFWLLRLPASAPFWHQLLQAKLPQRLGVVAGLFLLVYGLEIAGWGMIGRAALDGRSDIGWLLAWALMIMSVIPLRLVGHWIDANLAISLSRLFKTRLLAGGLNLDIETVRHQGAGQMLARVMESQAFESIALQGGFGALIALIELGFAGWILAMGAAGGLHLFLLAVWLLVAFLVASAYARQLGLWSSKRLALTHHLVERMVGHRTILAQEWPNRRDARDDRDMKDYLTTSAAMDRSVLPFLAGIPGGWMILGLLGLAPTFIRDGASPAGLAISLGGILLANRALSGLSGGLAAAARAAIAWRQISPLFKAAARDPSPLPYVDNTPGTAKPGSRLIDAESLHFSYGQRQILAGASLQINHGDRILLQGHSGGGKSTLSSLLVGLRKPQSGLLLLNGLDHHTLGRSWHDFATEAPQFHENHILSGTLGFNLLMGRGWPATDADLEEARQLCIELGLGDVISRMPSGMMQMIGETGWQLSHGEKSRIFLARALLQDAELTILDESFAALDPETLELCMQTVFRRARTLIVVAHP